MPPMRLRGGGGCTSKQAAKVEVAAPVSAADAEVSGRAERLLDALARDAAAKPAVSLPVTTHAERLPSARRGVSAAFLRGFCAFLARHGAAHRKRMAFVNRGQGFNTSVCALTATTGLSLVESLVLVAEREGISTHGLFDQAHNFFSYSWEGSTPAALLDAIESAEREKASEAGGGGLQYTWIE